MQDQFRCNNVSIGTVIILIVHKPHTTLHHQDVPPVRPFVLLKVSSSFIHTIPYYVAHRAMASAAPCTGGAFFVCAHNPFFHRAATQASSGRRFAHQLNNIMQRMSPTHLWKRRAIYSFAVPLLLLSACQHDPVAPTDQPTICFTTQVLPIFQSNCAKSGCHNSEGEGGIVLSNADDILKHVTPGKPLQSVAYTSMFSVWSGMMPPAPNPPVSAEARQLVELWILQGANTNCTGN